MNIEIHKPELEALILQRVHDGGLTIEEVLMQALQGSPAAAQPRAEFRDQRTGADLIAALQASPHRDLDIEPPRFCSPMLARDVTF